MATSSLGQPLGSTTTATRGINAPFQPAVNQLLQGATAAAAKPYEAYGGQRIAGFSDLQNKAMSGIAGLQGFQPTQYTSQSFTAPGMQQQYMSPYQQGVTDIEKREAQRAADIRGTQLGANAVNQGAFGGYRHGLVEAEQARNTAQQLGDIQARGSQRAFEMGQQQFNAEQQRDMARQQAQELANRYGYQTGISALGQQLDVGGMQQNLAQRGLDVGYQDYLNRMKYPYEQMNFLRSSLSGLPLESSTTSQSYDKPGGFQQALGGLGAATSLYNMGKDSGLFKGVGSLFGNNSSGSSGFGAMSDFGTPQRDLNSMNMGQAGLAAQGDYGYSPTSFTSMGPSTSFSAETPSIGGGFSFGDIKFPE
jgi:hypothetical protein